MLTRLEMKFREREVFNYQMSSLFHGILMEQVSSQYGEYLHQSQLHPYTQHLECREKEWYWIVNTLNQEAAQQIIYHKLFLEDTVNVKKQDRILHVEQKNVETHKYQELANQFYLAEGSRYVQIHFITPTAFKQQGKYIFYPDLRCIYQSLMNKYDAAVKEESMCDEETLEELCRCSEIRHYDLKSTQFYLEGVKIPSFIGKITVRLRGTQTMANFSNMLFWFGTYSGVGIKTALGMGAIKLIGKGEQKA